MSGAGFFYGDQQGGTTPEDMYRKQMAMQLIGGQNQQQGGGLGMLGSALALKAMQQRQDKNAYDRAPPTTAQVPFQGIGGQPMSTEVSSKMPYMGSTGLKGLFSFGGGG